MIPKNDKLLDLDGAVARRRELARSGQTVVLTNGCFDLLHTGHLAFLQEAASLGGALFVGLNGDRSVAALKGPTRPVQSELERAYLLAALTCVDTVFIFQTPRLDREIVALRPDLYTKAGDYNLDTLHPSERQALEQVGAGVRFLPFLEGYSTTRLIERIAQAAKTF